MLELAIGTGWVTFPWQRAGIHQGIGAPGGWPGILGNYAKIAAA